MTQHAVSPCNMVIDTQHVEHNYPMATAKVVKESRPGMVFVFDPPNEHRIRYAIWWPLRDKPSFYTWMPHKPHMGQKFAPTWQVRTWLHQCLFENGYDFRNSRGVPFQIALVLG